MSEVSESLDRLIYKADEITDKLTRIENILTFCGQSLLNIEKKLDVLKPANLEQLMKSFGFEAKE